MVTFWSYLGWSLVGLTGVAYVFAFYRLVLFPKPTPAATKQKARQVA